MGLQNLCRFKAAWSIWINMIIFFFLAGSVLSSDSGLNYEACKPKSCGTGPNISYPFFIRDNGTDYCGHPGFAIRCERGSPVYRTSNAHYMIREISYEERSFRLVNLDVIKNISCPTPLQNYSFDRSSVDFEPHHADIYFFYNCSDLPSANYTNSKVACSSDVENQTFAALVPRDEDVKWNRTACGYVVAAPVELHEQEINQTRREFDYKKLLSDGFKLKWVGLGYDCAECQKSGGKCGFDREYSVCYCPDGSSHSKHCHDGEDKKRLGLGLGLGLGAPFILAVLFYIVHYKKRWSLSGSLSGNSSSSDPSLNADLEEGSVYFGVPVFSYNELEEATSKFDTDNELGDGGFGTVYYGKLKDGREVAVKRLYEHNFKRVEQFMNEVEILTRLRHKNLVLLYGCTSRRSRDLLLVYEYIPNGTLADHLHGDRAKPSPLSWPVRMSIAIDTASALAYLHASDIIHRDVKTTNILLDNNFCVKVADFGLSRLFPTDVTHISTAPQGTPGYVDPEYYQCYQLTDKSDVYSFGVVLMELVSSMPAVDITRDRSEINLSNLAINKIQKNAFDELIDLNLGYNTDEEVKRMTTSVAELGFRCLQQDKEMRPDMEEVVKELDKIQKGNAEEKQEEVQKNDRKESLNPSAPPSPQDCDEAALLRNVGMTPPSPDSVTEQWLSCSSYASNLSG